MAESPPTIAANDYFAATAKFHAQTSSTSETKQQALVIDAEGDYACSEEFNTGDEFMSEYKYCKGETADIDGDATVWMTTFGEVLGSGVMTEMRIHFEAGEPATVTIDGHQHDGAQAHVVSNLDVFDVSGIIPASSGVGVPTLITVVGTVSPVSADITFNANHVDKVGADGVHWHGQNVGPCKVSISVNYEGTLTSATAGDWLNIVIAKSGDNQDTPTSSLTAEQYVDRT